MSANVEPVIAGSRGFALALLAPLTERIGTRPRIAADAAALRPFCTGPAGLVVVEFLGADTLRAIEALVGELKHLRVVAAVPEKLAAVDAPLRALGVEVARWDGTAAPVVGAVDRQLALAAAAWPPRAAIPPPAPAHPPPARSPTGAAVPVTHPPPARATPARATPPPSPGTHAPPVRPSPAHPPPAPAAAAESLRTPGAPPTAVAARLGAIVPASSQATTAVAPHPPPGSPAPVVASAAPAAAASPASGPSEASVRSMGGGSVYRPPPPPAAWPASAPGAMEAADALREALSGDPPAADSPLAYLAEVVASLSDVERAVLSDAPQPFDAEPIRDAAVMRVRVAAALATAPGAGGAAPVDGAAVSALLADIDALLARVSALAEGAPEHLQPSLEAVRNALVREAIDFSEAIQRASGGSGAGLARPLAATRRAATRVLSTDPERTAPRRRRAAGWIALATVVALAGGHRAWSWHVRTTARAALSAGLPAGLTEIPRTPGGPRVLVRASTTEAPDPAEIARLKATEEARGNTVREADGMIFIAPAAADQTANAGP